MAVLNPHFQKLKTDYIFPVIEKKVSDFKKKNPSIPIFNLGVGDVSLPLAPKIAEAMQSAIEEMTVSTHGYGPPEGQDFLRNAICKEQYAQYGLSPDEIFISDGTNSDTCAIQELFDTSCTVGMTDPTYPVYYGANIIAGKKIYLLPTTKEQGFIPKPPKQRLDLVYICTPANPTGTALNFSELQEWVDWAISHEAILCIDNVYSSFISSDEIPPSVYAIAGANKVAIEMRSFSKSAGFTGLRCGYSVWPKTLELSQLNEMWLKRTNIKSNGVSYPIQRGAEACFSDEGKKQLQEQITLYRQSAKILSDGLEKLDQIFFGGKHSPYIWWKIPIDGNSWEFFDILLENCHMITIPGSGFGACGEGFVRLSSFIKPTIAKGAIDALHHYFATNQLFSQRI